MNDTDLFVLILSSNLCPQRGIHFLVEPIESKIYSLWENDGEPECSSKSWVDLTVAEQAAATLLGYDRKKWDQDSDTGDDDDSSDNKNSPYDDYDWNKLPPNVVTAAETLGYTQHIWDSGGDGPMDDMDWSELTAEQREAANVLGYDQRVWDGDAESEDTTSCREINHSYDAVKWRDLPPEVISAAKQLGYTKSVWNAKCSTAIRAKDWYELTPKQRNAAKILGYDEIKWCNLNDDQGLWSYDNDNYDDLPEYVQIAAGVLGYSKAVWDSGGKSHAGSKDWDELTVQEQEAASILGYNERKWNDGDSDSDSDSDGDHESAISEKKSAPDQNLGDVLYGYISGVLSSHSRSSPAPAAVPPSSPVSSSQRDIVAGTSAAGLSATSGSEEASSKEATVRPTYDDYSWTKLPRKAQDAATVLGYTQATWDDDGIPPSAEKEWKQLSLREQRAASVLGYSQPTWDEH